MVVAAAAAPVTFPGRKAATLAGDPRRWEGGGVGGELRATRTMAVTPAARLAQPRQRWGVVAWALWVLVVFGLAAGFWLEGLLRRAGRPDALDTAVGPTLAAVSAATVGAVLAARRPRHPVGWLLLAFALLLAANGVAGGYAPYGLQVRPGALPAAAWVAMYYRVAAVTPLALVGVAHRGGAGGPAAGHAAGTQATGHALPRGRQPARPAPVR